MERSLSMSFKLRFDIPNRFDELIDYIIGNYNSENSLYLIKLVSENYGRIKSWFIKQELKYSGNGKH